MFRVTQELRLNTGAQSNDTTRNLNNNNNNYYSNSNSIVGKYQKTPEVDAYPDYDYRVFVAPELTDASKVQLLHFPNGAVRTPATISFVLKRNGVKGNFDIQLENPFGVKIDVPLQILDPERFDVKLSLSLPGLYKLHIKCNSVELPKSPFIIVSIGGDVEERPSNKIELPVFRSDASKVTHQGLRLSRIYIQQKNEFTINASAAGSNMLFVALLGPDGQCDEVVIKHIGGNIYKVTYQIKYCGEYILAIKWGEEHIPESPFHLNAIAKE